jgi:hypothetical protein
VRRIHVSLTRLTIETGEEHNMLPWNVAGESSNRRFGEFKVEDGILYETPAPGTSVIQGLAAVGGKSAIRNRI